MGVFVRNLQAMCTVRGNNGGTIIFAAGDSNRRELLGQPRTVPTGRSTN
eukprot:SAG31_NODE_38551_length_295_cov_0.816327_1_plen_48_part_01